MSRYECDEPIEPEVHYPEEFMAALLSCGMGTWE